MTNLSAANISYLHNLTEDELREIVGTNKDEAWRTAAKRELDLRFDELVVPGAKHYHTQFEPFAKKENAALVDHAIALYRAGIPSFELYETLGEATFSIRVFPEKY